MTAAVKWLCQKCVLVAQDAARKRIKCVLLCRNPKDTVVSFYNHTKGMTPYQYNGKFQNYLEMFMRGDGESFFQSRICSFVCNWV